MGYSINLKTEVGSDYSAQEVNVKRKTVFLVFISWVRASTVLRVLKGMNVPYVFNGF
jgi:hypothetical protein